MAEKTTLSKTSEPTKSVSPSPAAKAETIVPRHFNARNLQQTIGNQAVQQLVKSGKLQAALKMGRPNDVYEQEADRIADQVMRMREPETASIHRQSDKGIQRLCAPCAQEYAAAEKEKRTVRRANLCPKCAGEDNLNIRRMPDSLATSDSSIPDNFVSSLGAGQPLDRATRDYFEPRFGMDFSHVRVHAGQRASESASSINALAYTLGSGIVFGAGQYQPNTIQGKRLLAHELTHVIHQSKEIGQDRKIRRAINVHDTGCPLDKLDNSKSSAQIGAMSGGTIAYGFTNLAISTPGSVRVQAAMINANQGEVWVDNVDVFAVAKVQIYLTNQFANMPCEADKVFAHEMFHWWVGCDIFERKIPLLQRALEALPGPNTKQSVNGNRAAVEQARKDLEARVRSILMCFRIEVCLDISNFNRRLDLRDYPQVFNSCPEPHPPVPQVPPIEQYLSSCSTPLPECSGVFQNQ